MFSSPSGSAARWSDEIIAPVATHPCTRFKTQQCSQPSDHHFLVVLYEMERDKRAKELAAHSKYEDEMEDGFREIVDWALQKLEMDFQMRVIRGK